MYIDQFQDNAKHRQSISKENLLILFHVQEVLSLHEFSNSALFCTVSPKIVKIFPHWLVSITRYRAIKQYDLRNFCTSMITD